MSKAKFLFLGLILLLGSLAAMGHVSAADFITVTLTANGPIEVHAGASGHNLLTFGWVGTEHISNVVISCTGLPTGASFSPSFLAGPFSSGDSFQLLVSTSPSTPPDTYPITCEAPFFDEATDIIAPSFAVSPISSSNNAGSLGPNSISIPQQPTPTFYLIVDPAPAIPEYPLGLPILAIFMIISYGLIRRRTSTKHI